MNIDDLSPEMMEKVRNAKTPEELLLIAQEEGYELSDEELEGISGGGMWGNICAGVKCGPHGNHT